jgi:uncharacterized membrane protein
MGWFLEVLYHIYKQHRFVNRGFLYGPICPIYGTTAVLLVIALTPLKDNNIYIFIGGAVLASLMELITGYLLEVLFKAKWWDYSKERFNIYGYICLKFSLLWGGLAIVFMKVIHPPISSFIHNIPSQYGEIIYNVLLVLFVVDVTVTINTLIQFRIIFMELHNISQEIKTNLENIKDKGLGKVFISRLEKRNTRLKELYESLSNRINLRHKVLLRAYPNSTSKKFGHIIEEVKVKIANNKKIRKVLKKLPEDN